MSRPGATTGEYKPYYASVLTGGLEVSRPPHLLDPSESPDLLNVVLNNSNVEKRGGFVPMIRQQPKLAAVKNYGVHGTMRVRKTAGASDKPFLIVPGCLYAGHRSIYDRVMSGSGASYAVECFFTIADLTSEHVGNGDVAGGGSIWQVPGDNTGYRLRVRPIVSKGPVKKYHDNGALFQDAGPAENNAIVWKNPTSGVSYWGPGITEQAMPFCIYLHQDGSGNWEFHVAWHSIKTGSGNWELLKIILPYTTLRPAVGVRYHLIFSITHGSTAKLRVGVLTDDTTIPTYYTNSTVRNSSDVAITFSDYRAPNATTPCALQVFDCPQEFIEAPIAPAVGRPPGLGYSAANDGAYWFACKRAEGTIESLAIWSSHKLSGSDSALDRISPLDLERIGQTELVGYWSMSDGTLGFVRELSGTGNHLYFVPAGPVYDGTAGGSSSKDRAAWWFNGTTSYVLADTMTRTTNTVEDLTTYAGLPHITHPNWRHQIDKDPAGGASVRKNGAFESLVRNNLPHGIEVSFRADSLESRFEQVLMEIQNVIRLVVDTDGKIRGYVKNDVDHTASVTTQLYQVTGGGVNHNHVVSPQSVVPGERYTVALFRSNSGQTLTLYVNGVNVHSVTTVASSANNWMVGGITIGGGCQMFTSRTNVAAVGGVTYPGDGDTVDTNAVNTDSRSYFCGLIESARILVGSPTSHPLRKDESKLDWELVQQQLWRQVSANSIQPENDDLTASASTGYMLGVPGHHYDYTTTYYRSTSAPLRYPISAIAVQAYTIAHNFNDPEDSGYFFNAGASDYEVDNAFVTVWHTFARWVFDRDDQDVDYAGSYVYGFEYGTNTATVPLIQPDLVRSVHRQLSAVTDETDCLGQVEKRCKESDVILLNRAASNYGSTENSDSEWFSATHRGRPYHFKSPRELCPAYVPGILVPLTGTNPISLIADFQHQQSGEQFVVIGCHRHFWWAKQPWRKDSPFVEETPWSLWAFGQDDDFAKILMSTAGQEVAKSGGNYSTVTFEGWVKPSRLDGNRLLALKGAPETPRVNFGIGFIDGSLVVFGTLDGGTKTWIWREGTYSGATWRPESMIATNRWNHVYLLIGSNSVTGAAGSSVVAWINGQKVTLTAQTATDAMTAGSNDAANYPLYLLGVPRYASGPTLAGATAVAITWQSWHGLLSEVRMTNAEESSAFPADKTAGYVPRARYADAASVRLLLHLNEGADWSLINSAAASLADHGTSYLRELIRIDDAGEATEDARLDRYTAVVYRDELIVTNGKSPPQRISFTRLSDPEGPFRLYRLGMNPPWGYCGFASFQRGAPYNVFSSAGVYDIYVSFLNDKGEESDPFLVYRHVRSSNLSADAFAGFRLVHIPRSADRQVVGRRFYVSTNGGGTPLWHTDIEDNKSYDHQLFGLPTGEVVEVGVRLPAPRAKHITAGNGSIFLGYLTDQESGANAIAFSDSDSIAYFPVGNQVKLDSENGKAVTGLKSHLGRLYIFKRDSTWQFALQGVDIPAEARGFLQPVNATIGIPGGLVVYDNLLYGAGERGPMSFDGANHVYIGRSLKDDYHSFDLTDHGILDMHGAFERTNSQYWLSLRQPGVTYNEYMYVLHTAVHDTRQSWTKLRVPQHVFFTSIQDPLSQAQQLVMGTVHGQLLRYDQDVIVDGHGDTTQNNQNTVIAGSASSGTTTSLTTVLPAGQTLDTIHGGLRGCKITVNGVERVIERNTTNTIYWREPLAGNAAGAYTIGGYDAYWTSGWIAPQDFGTWIVARELVLEFGPNSAGLVLDNVASVAGVQTTRAFPGAYETRTVSMADGYTGQNKPVTRKQQGKYFRIRFGASGARDRFAVSAWGLKFGDTGVHGKPA